MALGAVLGAAFGLRSGIWYSGGISAHVVGRWAALVYAGFPGAQGRAGMAPALPAGGGDTQHLHRGLPPSRAQLEKERVGAGTVRREHGTPSLPNGVLFAPAPLGILSRALAPRQLLGALGATCGDGWRATLLAWKVVLREDFPPAASAGRVDVLLHKDFPGVNAGSRTQQEIIAHALREHGVLASWRSRRINTVGTARCLEVRGGEERRPLKSYKQKSQKSFPSLFV